MNPLLTEQALLAALSLAGLAADGRHTKRILAYFAGSVHMISKGTYATLLRNYTNIQFNYEYLT